MKGAVAKLDAGVQRLYERGCTTGKQLQQVKAGRADLKADIADIESLGEQRNKSLLEEGRKLQGRATQCRGQAWHA